MVPFDLINTELITESYGYSFIKINRKSFESPGQIAQLVTALSETPRLQVQSQVRAHIASEKTNWCFSPLPIHSF